MRPLASALDGEEAKAAREQSFHDCSYVREDIVSQRVEFTPSRQYGKFSLPPGHMEEKESEGAEASGHAVDDPDGAALGQTTVNEDVVNVRGLVR
jgi:hypothetical protein